MTHAYVGVTRGGFVLADIAKGKEVLEFGGVSVIKFFQGSMDDPTELEVGWEAVSVPAARGGNKSVSASSLKNVWFQVLERRFDKNDGNFIISVTGELCAYGHGVLVGRGEQ